MVVLEIIGLLLISFSFILLIYDIGVKQTAKFMQLFINWKNQIFSWGIVILGLSIIPAFIQSQTPKIEINKAKLFKSMISDKNLYNRLNQVLEESPDKNLAMNILISDSEYDLKLNKSKYEFIFTIIKDLAILIIGNFFTQWISTIEWIEKNFTLLIIIIFFIIYCIIILFYAVYLTYKEFYISIKDLKNYTLALYIKDYVTGYITCQWDI